MENEQVEKKYDDEIIFINKSDYTSEEFREINIELSKRYLKVYLICGIVILLCAALVLVADIVLDEYDSIYLPVVFFASGSVFVALYFYMFYAIRKNPNANKAMNYEFLFYPDKIVASVSGDGVNATEEKRYSDIKYIRITNNHIFMYLTKINAYILKKDANTERLVSFLSSNKGIRIK